MTDIRQEVGELKGLVTGLDDKLDTLQDSQEEQWREFRKEQGRANKDNGTIINLLHDAELERTKMAADLKATKDNCDIRYKDSEKYKKTKLALLLSILPPVGAAVYDWLKTHL